jgi:hypothetical protein
MDRLAPHSCAPQPVRPADCTPTEHADLWHARLHIFLALVVVSDVYDNGTGGPLVTGVFLTFAALSLLMVAEYCFARHELTSDGMNYGAFAVRSSGARLQTSRTLPA